MVGLRKLESASPNASSQTPTPTTISQVDSSGLYRNPSKNTKAKVHSLRLVGVDDGGFFKHRAPAQNQTALILAALLQGSRILSIKLGRITVDGNDATRVLLSLLRRMRYDVILLSGISFAGFNLVDIRKLSQATRRPVIAITGQRPNNAAVLSALRKHFPDWKERWRIVKGAGRLYSCKPLAQEPELYFEVKGASAAFARKAIACSAAISRLPEPIRVAGILARGLSPLGLGLHEVDQAYL
jgi:uncharacterized protein